MNPDPDKIQIVYRPKTDAEARRRVARMDRLIGTPFIPLPGNPPVHKVLFVSSDGHKVRVCDVQMVFNDALLADAVSEWGEDGPLYEDTLDNATHREAFEYARKAYASVKLPPHLVNPRKPS